MKRSLALILILALTVTGLMGGCDSRQLQEALNLMTVTPMPEQPTQTPPPTPVPDFAVSLNSPYAGLYRRSDGMALFEKNAGGKMYPASMTKMMTALVALEHLPDLQEKITLDAAMFEALYEADASMAGFLPGEQVTAIDLVYGVLLPSGAECSIGLAQHIAGSEEAFVELMNEKAQALGMSGTHFVNTSGLHDEEHYTTIRDLSVLLNAALENETFRQIFTTARHSTQKTDQHPDGITFYSTMFAQIQDASLSQGKILGGKTGYTSAAGLCLASLAEWNGEEYLCITGGAARDEERSPLNIQDAFTAYEELAEAA